MPSSENQNRIVAILALSLLAAGCGRRPVILRGDPAPIAVSSERIASWRDEVSSLEARQIRGIDPGSFARVRSWLDRLEASGDEPQLEALLAAAVQGELEVLRTAERRYGALAGDSEVQP